MTVSSEGLELAVLFSSFIDGNAFGLGMWTFPVCTTHCSKHKYLPIKSVLPVLKGGVCQQLACDWADFLSVMCKRFSGVLSFKVMHSRAPPVKDE